MDNNMIDFLHERVKSFDVKIDHLTEACQNLAITATRHESQLKIISGLVFGFATIVLSAFVYSLVYK